MNKTYIETSLQLKSICYEKGIYRNGNGIIARFL
jgi:hypothetical protein